MGQESLRYCLRVVGNADHRHRLPHPGGHPHPRIRRRPHLQCLCRVALPACQVPQEALQDPKPGQAPIQEQHLSCLSSRANAQRVRRCSVTYNAAASTASVPGKPLSLAICSIYPLFLNSSVINNFYLLPARVPGASTHYSICAINNVDESELTAGNLVPSKATNVANSCGDPAARMGFDPQGLSRNDSRLYY